MCINTGVTNQPVSYYYYYYYYYFYYYSYYYYLYLHCSWDEKRGYNQIGLGFGKFAHRESDKWESETDQMRQRISIDVKRNTRVGKIRDYSALPTHPPKVPASTSVASVPEYPVSHVQVRKFTPLPRLHVAEVSLLQPSMSNPQPSTSGRGKQFMRRRRWAPALKLSKQVILLILLLGIHHICNETLRLSKYLVTMNMIITI